MNSNSSIHETTKFSPFSLVHGREARLLVSPELGVHSALRRAELKKSATSSKRLNDPFQKAVDNV